MRHNIIFAPRSPTLSAAGMEIMQIIYFSHNADVTWITEANTEVFKF